MIELVKERKIKLKGRQCKTRLNSERQLHALKVPDVTQILPAISAINSVSCREEKKMRGPKRRQDEAETDMAMSRKIRYLFVVVLVSYAM